MNSGASRDGNTAQHLCCISALKKLCNHPLLIYKDASAAAELAASAASKSSAGTAQTNSDDVELEVMLQCC